jgi:hypothetical protein
MCEPFNYRTCLVTLHTNMDSNPSRDRGPSDESSEPSSNTSGEGVRLFILEEMVKKQSQMLSEILKNNEVIDSHIS